MSAACSCMRMYGLHGECIDPSLAEGEWQKIAWRMAELLGASADVVGALRARVMASPYASCYCEENVYQLLVSLRRVPDFRRCFAVFIGSQSPFCPVWCQRSARRAEEPVDPCSRCLGGRGAVGRSSVRVRKWIRRLDRTTDACVFQLREADPWIRRA